MKKTQKTTNKTTPMNSLAPIETLMRQQSNNFYVERDEAGQLIYHWIDTRVEMLSSSKLWNILGNLETPSSDLDQAFAEAITNELINRSDFFDSKPMPVSH